MKRTQLFGVLVATTTLGALAPAAVTSAHQPTDRPLVCNEAQSAVIQGNAGKTAYDASGSTDPTPPARHKPDSMKVGIGVGLLGAAENSPALALCEDGEIPT